MTFNSIKEENEGGGCVNGHMWSRDDPKNPPPKSEKIHTECKSTGKARPWEVGKGLPTVGNNAGIRQIFSQFRGGRMGWDGTGSGGRQGGQFRDCRKW